MTKTYCDRCKTETEKYLLSLIHLHPEGKVFEHMDKRGLLRGLMIEIELCPACLQEFSWIASSWKRGELVGKDPFEKKVQLV